MTYSASVDGSPDTHHIVLNRCSRDTTDDVSTSRGRSNINRMLIQQSKSNISWKNLMFVLRTRTPRTYHHLRKHGPMNWYAAPLDLEGSVFAPMDRRSHPDFPAKCAQTSDTNETPTSLEPNGHDD